MTGRHNQSPAAWNRDKIRRFRHRLLEWYGREKRALPWRSDPNPYRVWVSEIMLQQTQVQTVLPYYRRFLERFPDLRSLAAASENEVLSFWAGLGYYRRARNLRLAAQKIESEFAGRFPEALESILQLPGVGRYTAGAIRSIAFNSPQPVVDGNVRRVLGRLHGIKHSLSEDCFWAEAAAMVSRTRPADFNQAMMDLGATICTHHRPACKICPVRTFCEARREGIQEHIPPPRRARAAKKIEVVLLVVNCADEVLVTSRSFASFIPGQYGLPGCMVDRGQSPEAAARELAHRIFGKTIPILDRTTIRHAITFRRICAYVFRTDAAKDCCKRKDYLWIPHSEFNRFVTSAVYLKALRSVNS